MTKAISDQYSKLPCRQRRYQLRKQKLGKCVICGEDAVNKTHCETHRLAANRNAEKFRIAHRASDESPKPT